MFWVSHSRGDDCTNEPSVSYSPSARRHIAYISVLEWDFGAELFRAGSATEWGERDNVQPRGAVCWCEPCQTLEAIWREEFANCRCYIWNPRGFRVRAHAQTYSRTEITERRKTGLTFPRRGGDRPSAGLYARGGSRISFLLPFPEPPRILNGPRTENSLSGRRTASWIARSLMPPGAGWTSSTLLVRRRNDKQKKKK